MHILCVFFLLLKNKTPKYIIIQVLILFSLQGAKVSRITQDATTANAAMADSKPPTIAPSTQSVGGDLTLPMPPTDGNPTTSTEPSEMGMASQPEGVVLHLDEEGLSAGCSLSAVSASQLDTDKPDDRVPTLNRTPDSGRSSNFGSKEDLSGGSNTGSEAGGSDAGSKENLLGGSDAGSKEDLLRGSNVSLKNVEIESAGEIEEEEGKREEGEKEEEEGEREEEEGKGKNRVVQSEGGVTSGSSASISSNEVSLSPREAGNVKDEARSPVVGVAEGGDQDQQGTMSWWAEAMAETEGLADDLDSVVNKMEEAVDTPTNAGGSVSSSGEAEGKGTGGRGVDQAEPLSQSHSRTGKCVYIRTYVRVCIRANVYVKKLCPL